MFRVAWRRDDEEPGGRRTLPPALPEPPSSRLPPPAGGGCHCSLRRQLAPGSPGSSCVLARFPAFPPAVHIPFPSFPTFSLAPVLFAFLDLHIARILLSASHSSPPNKQKTNPTGHVMASLSLQMTPSFLARLLGGYVNHEVILPSL